MINNDLETFFNRLMLGNKKVYHSLNTINNGIFSRNTFVRCYNDIKYYVEINKCNDCYINYMPLKENTSRKTDNVKSITLIALDIELTHKTIPEKISNMNIMKGYIHEYLNIHNIQNYMLINSGNGYHLYMFLKTPKVIKEDNLQILKSAYKNVVQSISIEISNLSNNLISSDDRKDLAGILRIPTTSNTKASRKVVLEENVQENDNLYLSKLFSSSLVKTKKQMLVVNNYNVNFDKTLKYSDLPKTFEELIKSPLVRIWLDNKLPSPTVGNWHKSIVFALQAVIYHSGLSDDPSVAQLSLEFNSIWMSSADLGSCSYKKDLGFPINCAIKFCKNNGYTEYEKEIKTAYINS
jgi:hypothetical protein